MSERPPQQLWEKVVEILEVSVLAIVAMATAFSPTDTLPVRVWAKMTMMVESVISLITAILVIARAINVLPG